MKDVGTFEIFLALLAVWGVVEIVRGWWQILLVLAAFGVLIYVIAHSERKPAESEPEYVVRSAPPKLPPMPYSTPNLPAVVDHVLDIAERAEAENWRAMYDEYYCLSDVIRTNRDIYAKLAACEASFEILPRFVEAQLAEYGELPRTILCRDEAPKLYMRLGQWSNARSAIERCIAAGAYDDGGESALEYLHRYESAARRAINFIRDNAGFPQSKIYKALPDVDSDYLKAFVRSSLLIRKERSGSTNKLYLIDSWRC